MPRSEDIVQYSETEIRWAINEVVGSVWAFWIFPCFNVRWWFQERIIRKLDFLKMDKLMSGQEVTLVCKNPGHHAVVKLDLDPTAKSKDET